MYIQLSPAVCLTAFNSFHQTLHPDVHLTVIDTHSALIAVSVGQLKLRFSRYQKFSNKSSWRRVQHIYCANFSLLFFPIECPTTKLHFPHPSNSFKSRRSRHSTLARSTTYEQPLPLPHNGIGGLWSARRFSKISSSAVFGLKSFNVYNRPLQSKRSIPVWTSVIYLHHSSTCLISLRHHHTPICLSTG
jgi:hypothetical protein